MGLIAREAALDVADGLYEPLVVEHIPGVANVLADVLSRRRDPKYAVSWSVPPSLLSPTPQPS